MRPSASSPGAEQPDYLHRITALTLVTNYLRLHPSRSFVRSVGVARYRFVSSLGIVSSCRSVSFHLVARSFAWSFARSVVIVPRLASVVSSVGVEERDQLVVVGSLIWLHPQATDPVHHVEVQADCTGAWKMSA
jgi:hypothetical protein